MYAAVFERQQLKDSDHNVSGYQLQQASKQQLVSEKTAHSDKRHGGSHAQRTRTLALLASPRPSPSSLLYSIVQRTSNKFPESVTFAQLHSDGSTSESIDNSAAMHRTHTKAIHGALQFIGSQVRAIALIARNREALGCMTQNTTCASRTWSSPAAACAPVIDSSDGSVTLISNLSFGICSDGSEWALCLPPATVTVTTLTRESPLTASDARGEST